MGLFRFYCENLNDTITELPKEQAKHLAVVKRLGAKNEIELFDGKGSVAIAKVIASGKKIQLEITSLKTVKKNNETKITIAASVAKRDRFDWMIAKCSEIGIDTIIPVIFERTVKQPNNPKIIQRWKKIAISAAKQCKSLFLTKIEKPITISEMMTKLANSNVEILVAQIDHKAQNVINITIKQKNVVIIGPEGGFTQNEIELFKTHNAKIVQITDTILRTETAAVAMAAVLAAKRCGL